MECNKGDAMRAKEIAEKRFTKKDILGAKKFAMRARDLNPELEGIQQMIATFDVYIASENKLRGDSDWYAILNVHPSADDDTVRKSYRKLALLLHPDKNKTVGAEGAFKFISQAWSLLSDKDKRASYDLMRRSRVSQQSSISVPSPATNGFNKVPKATAARAPKGSTKVPPSSQKPNQATFWTACYRCKMQYEYLRVYLNNNLLCPNCRKAFFAVETGPPRDRAVKTSTAQWSFSQQQKKSTHQPECNETRNLGKNKVPNQGDDLGKSSGPGSARQSNYTWNAYAGASSASNPARAAMMVQQAYETVKREREEAQATRKRDEALKRKATATRRMSSVHQGPTKRKRYMDDVGVSNHRKEFINQEDACRYKLESTMRPYGTDKYIGGSEISHFRYVLIEKAKKEIKIYVDRSTSTTTSNAKKQLAEDEKEEIDNMAVNSLYDASCYPSNKDDSFLEVSSVKLSKLSTENFIDVPEPNFHSFNQDRTEESFEENQVWAAYDDNDAMPRLYARIHRVISRVPFKVQISWLNAKYRSELSLPNGTGYAYVKACGEFRAGSRLKKVDVLECFSHKVRWRKTRDGMIQIVPRKGDVWAIYRNWSPEWNELTTDEMITKYDLVEVVMDPTEDGVIIIPLVKVAGFRTVFHRHLDLGQIQTVPQDEMSRFSHYVPSRMLSGVESQSTPKGCHELDPAAVPIQLLQTYYDIKDEETDTLTEFTDHIVTDVVEKTDKSDMVLLPVEDMHERIQLNSNETPGVCS